MTRSAVIVRVLAAAGSLVVTAWFILGAVQARDVDRADTLITGGGTPTAAQARAARSLLDTASTLNPDTQIDQLRSQLAWERGNRAEAFRLATAVTRQEPQNAQAWVQLIAVTKGPEVLGEIRHLGALAPNVPASR
jgi:hypothetical protein